MSLTPVANFSQVLEANLPLVSTTPAELVAKFAAGGVDTGGEFTASVDDIGDKFATGVVDTGGSPRQIFEKI